MYVTPDDRVPFEEWLLALRDARARARIRVRIDRLAIKAPKPPIFGKPETTGWSINEGGASVTKLTKSYQESLLAALQDPAEAAEYLSAALEEGDRALFLLALRNVAEAKGIGHLATQAHLNRESLYRMLSEQGNPQLSSLTALLDAMNLRLAVTVKQESA
jgi:probable addiction module antidote protein